MSNSKQYYRKHHFWGNLDIETFEHWCRIFHFNSGKFVILIKKFFWSFFLVRISNSDRFWARLIVVCLYWQFYRRGKINGKQESSIFGFPSIWTFFQFERISTPPCKSTKHFFKTVPLSPCIDSRILEISAVCEFFENSSTEWISTRWSIFRGSTRLYILETMLWFWAYTPWVKM